MPFCGDCGSDVGMDAGKVGEDGVFRCVMCRSTKDLPITDLFKSVKYRVSMDNTGFRVNVRSGAINLTGTVSWDQLKDLMSSEEGEEGEEVKSGPKVVNMNGTE